MGLTINQELATRLAQALMTSMTDQKAWTFAAVREKILAVLDSASAEAAAGSQDQVNSLRAENATLRELYAKPQVEGKVEPS